MDHFGTAHVLMITLFLLGLGPVIWLGRRTRASGGLLVSRIVAVLIVLATLPFLLIELATNFDIDTALPLHLCDLAWPAAVWGLWTHHRLPVALTYFWGLVLTTQGIVTPSLKEDFPDIHFFAFWALHLLVVWSAVFLVWGLGRSPTWRDYATTVAVTFGWLFSVLAFNTIADTNYGYLLRKPGSSSLLDYLGPWPWYVVAEISIVAVVWALMTWPWVRARVSGRPRSPRRRTTSG